MVQFRVKKIKFLDSKLEPMIARLLKKGVIRNIDILSIFRHKSVFDSQHAPTCETEFLNSILPNSFLLNSSSSLKKPSKFGRNNRLWSDENSHYRHIHNVQKN